MSISACYSDTDQAQEIVAGFIAQDPSAFDALKCKMTSLKCYVESRVGGDAQDVYRELLVDLAAAIRDGRLTSVHALYAHANVIARRKINSAQPVRATPTTLRNGDWWLFGGRSVSSEYAHRAAEEQQIALRILKTAPHCDREALARFYLNEQSPEEICRDLRLTLEEFGLIKSRAKARFRELCAARVARKPAKSETRVSHPGQALGAQLSK